MTASVEVERDCYLRPIPFKAAYFGTCPIYAGQVPKYAASCRNGIRHFDLYTHAY
jgi:hypothetical protein